MRKSPMEFGRAVARAQDETRRAAPIIREVGETLFAEPFSRRRENRAATRKMVFRSAAVAAVFVAVLAAVAVFTLPRPVPLGLTVDGKTVSRPARKFIESGADDESSLRFSDGSHVVLAASTRARIIDTFENGAAVLVEQGAITVSIVHRDDTRWRFEVGPYTVHVTGTAFGVSWLPKDGVFSLTLEEGSVAVAGPAIPVSRTVAAGETLKAWPRLGKSILASTEFENSASPLSVTPAADLPRTALPSDGTVSSNGRAKTSPPAPRLKERSALLASIGQPRTQPQPSAKAIDKRETPPSSDHDLFSLTPPAAPDVERSHADALPSSEALPPIVEDDAVPIASPQAQRNPQALLRGAAQSRAAGDIAGAKQIYLSIRVDYPKSQSAANAAFALGRIAYDIERDYEGAVIWFSNFIHENQSSILSREAQGRLMEAYLRTNRRAEAAKIAQRYMKAYPNGPHATLARSILDE